MLNISRENLVFLLRVKFRSSSESFKLTDRFRLKVEPVLFPNECKIKCCVLIPCRMESEVIRVDLLHLLRHMSRCHVSCLMFHVSCFSVDGCRSAASRTEEEGAAPPDESLSRVLSVISSKKDEGITSHFIETISCLSGSQQKTFWLRRSERLKEIRFNQFVFFVPFLSLLGSGCCYSCEITRCCWARSHDHNNLMWSV